MQIYTYKCDDCNHVFTRRYTYDNYQDKPKCPECKENKNVYREYIEDNFYSSIKLADSEIKKLGHLAHRNGEKFSDDYKRHLNRKHTKYLRNRDKKELPRGMKMPDIGSDDND